MNDKPKIHVMIDLETMSNEADGAIVAIGACLFSADGVGKTFYRNIDLVSAVKAGGTITPSTVMWWMQQSAEARLALTEQPLASMAAALAEFAEWLGAQPIAGIWGNGVDFDNVLLRSAYQRLDLTVPWSFRLNRCYRTMKALFAHVPVPKFGTELVAHRADHDAIRQAAHLFEINLGLGFLG